VVIQFGGLPGMPAQAMTQQVIVFLTAEWLLYTTMHKKCRNLCLRGEDEVQPFQLRTRPCCKCKVVVFYPTGALPSC
jgi:hypothetical protein